MFFIDSRITVRGDVVATINNIIAKELLFRIDTTITLLMFIGVVILSLVLYKILKPVNKHLARLALLWRFAEAILGIFAALSSFIVLLFLTGENNLEIFGTEQFYALSELILGIYWEATITIFILLALGSMINFYLFHISKYIPKVLAIWGIVSYTLVLIGALTSLIFSGNAYMILGSQAILFEIVIGCWLLFKGVNV
jgi:hypothetical protein